MKIVHIVSSINKINFGVWNAAVFASDYLEENYNISSELWISSRGKEESIKPQIPFYYFGDEQKKKNGFGKWIMNFQKNETIVVTHGAWLLPTRMGYWAKNLGFRWIYTPHGMFEPDEASKGHLKKFFYFHLFENRYLKKSDIIRAVSEIEKANLREKTKREISVIYNGVRLPSQDLILKSGHTLNFLFLARLQKKKGLIFFVKAWAETMYQELNARLVIAGPDEGELDIIYPYVKNNISYVGPVFGKEKEKLLTEAHYYVLPSFSEGFPTSVVEAMSYGAIPLISKGCNFPAVFSERLGHQIEPDINSIQSVMKDLRNDPFNEDLSKRNREYIKEHLAIDKIGDRLYDLYIRILKN